LHTHRTTGVLHDKGPPAHGKAPTIRRKKGTKNTRLCRKKKYESEKEKKASPQRRSCDVIVAMVKQTKCLTSTVLTNHAKNPNSHSTASSQKSRVTRRKKKREGNGEPTTSVRSKLHPTAKKRKERVRDSHRTRGSPKGIPSVPPNPQNPTLPSCERKYRESWRRGRVEKKKRRRKKRKKQKGGKSR
jgi:hypothetical protein